jgi:hemerythrin-like domain-containing protein
MQKHKSYAAPHKGLRNLLGQFSLLAGNTNFGALTEVQQLQKLGNELFFLLKHHLQTENEDLLAFIETKVPGAAKYDLQEHEQLEILQDDLEARLQGLDGSQTDEEGHQFYLDFTSFHGKYLEHIYQEEKVTEELLLKHFSTEELQENSARIMQKVDFTVLISSLKYIIPAQSIPENEMLMLNLKNAPKELKSTLFAALKNQVSDAFIEKLKKM